jgi:hypothetical protein
MAHLALRGPLKGPTRRIGTEFERRRLRKESVLSKQLSNGSTFLLIMRKELKVIAAAAFMFWVFPRFHGSPLACLARHQACNATPSQHKWLMWTFCLLALWVLWTAGCGLPGEHRNRFGMWVKDR